MQVISRRENEGVVIGEDVFVTVLEVGVDHVRLGIHSPERTPSYWEETLSWQPQEQTAELQLSAARF